MIDNFKTNTDMDELTHGDEVWAWDEDEIEDKVYTIFIGMSIEEDTEFPYVCQFPSGEVYAYMNIQKI